jgi:uncharacterized membrane protein
VNRRVFHTRDRGAVIPIVALLLPVLILMTAFAVDLGRQRVLRRDLQAAADVIALDLRRLADNPITPPDAPTTLAALNASRARNGMSTVVSLDGTDGAVVQWGNWTPPAAAGSCPLTIVNQPPSCFTELAVGTAAQPINAVRVVFDDDVDYFFQPGRGSATRAAVAIEGGVGSFSIGSQLAALDTVNSPLLGPLMAGLFGSPDAISLDVLAHEGLANANVDLGDWFDIAEVTLGLASPDQVLDSEISLLQLIDITAAALDASGDGVEVDAALAYLDLLRLNVDPTLSLRVGDLLNLGVSEPGAVVDAQVNLFDMLLLGAQVANNDNLVDIPFELSPDLVELIPVVSDLANLSSSLRVGVIEAPQIATGPIGTSARTSQIRVQLQVNAELDVSLSALLGPLDPLVPSVAQVALNIPVTVEVANGRATLVDLQCRVPEDQSILGLAVATSAARALIGTVAPGQELTDIGSTTAEVVNLAEVSLLGIRLAVIELGTAVEVGTPTSQRLDLPVGQSDSVEAGQLGLADLVKIEANPRLLDNVPLLGPVLNAVIGPLVGPILTGVLNSLLLPVLDIIDTLVVAPLLDLLGVGVAGADVNAISADCEQLRLAE